MLSVMKEGTEIDSCGEVRLQASEGVVILRPG